MESKIVITGAAGLVGQNLIVLLKEKGYTNIVAFDKHEDNIGILREVNPDITVVQADLAEPGEWKEYFRNAEVVLQLHAQIGALTMDPFTRNNVSATENVLNVIREFSVPYLVHISSSVVESVADDFYTNSKKEQERIVVESGLPCCILRPTLMFGWFDRKHFGWLSRFMERHPVFPIPGSGRYMRQPLYVRDFCRIIIAAMEQRPDRKIYNITGREKIDYIDIIRKIKKVKRLRTVIVRIPFRLFHFMMSVYSLFSKNPPFTTQQLKALTAGDEFEVIPWDDIFSVQPTPFEAALSETFNDPVYSGHILKF